MQSVNLSTACQQKAGVNRGKRYRQVRTRSRQQSRRQGQGVELQKRCQVQRTGLTGSEEVSRFSTGEFCLG
ncbi:MAG: hypothetical protein ACFFD4_39755 [Candidatus Odinarchaeota archaeon]